MNIRDRIKEFKRVRADQLQANPRNWRTHPPEQQDALRGVLAEVGIVDAVIARELPDGKLELIDGHLRAETMPDELLPVLVLDVNEFEAIKLLAALDPLGAMAETDAAALEALLATVDTESAALKDLLAELASDAGISGERAPTVLRPLDPQPPPAMSWVLVGIPTVRFGEIAELIERIADVDGITLETTSNNG